MLNNLISLIAAAAYYYFNWRYFKLVSVMLAAPRMKKLPVLGAFLLNYGLFYVCSILEFNLLVNWALFFVLLLVETLLCCKGKWRIALFVSMNGILHGLTVNIFCRCVVSIVTAQPLSAFDNTVNSLKALPVFLGFLLGGIVFHLMIRPKAQARLQILIDHPSHLAFQLELMGGMFVYLFLNLLLYQSPGNQLLLKLWGIKSCVFSLMGTYLGMRYSLQMCRLSDYRERNRVLRQELVQKEREEQALRSTAYRDPLTGVYNRPYILEQLNALLLRRAPFTLCFLDLDDLKGVNDRCGHNEGDRYLVSVATELELACRKGTDLLARYGGDEFMLLFPEASVAVVEERIRRVDQRLVEKSRGESALFPMSISFGAVDGGLTEEAQTLISAADEKMYRQKQAKRVQKKQPI